MTGNLDSALKYREKGFSVIPVRGVAYTFGKDEKEKYDNAKLPLIKTWLPYQQKHATEDEIQTWFKEWPKAGIAVITGKISGLTVLDLDSAEAIEYFLTNHNPQTPCADTPKGMHVYYTYQEGTRNTVKINGLDLDLRSEGGYIVAPPSINAEGKSYRWIQNIFDVPLAPLPEFLKEQINNSVDVYKGPQRMPDSAFFIEGRRDEDLFHVANALVKGGANLVIAKQVLEIIANNCTPPFPEKEIPIKIKSALDRSGRRDRNLSEEIRGWIMATEAWFNVTALDKEIGIESRQERHVRRQILYKFAEDNLIEKDRSREGYYRRIEGDLEQIDIFNDEGQEVPVVFPFEIHKLIKLYPKNIVIVAGEPNAGKTGLLLNIARLNKDKIETDYFSSEMGRLEIRERLLKFGTSLDTWKKVKFYERAGSFDKVMNPNRLTIIDFLEIYDKFWEIAAMIRDVYDKLDKGVAIIAIQKNPTRKNRDGSTSGEYGIGGIRGLEKARLYLTMGHGKVKIVKGKNWRTEQNPNNLQRDFKLVAGCNFQSQGDWYKDSDTDPKGGI